MSSSIFKVEMEVRDYECDMEGIVNNAVYMNYLEHARHGLLRQRGLNFAELIRNGIQLVAIRIEADYRHPLRSGDKFYVTASTEKISKLRFGFTQGIYRLPDDKPILQAKVFGTSLNANGQPKYFEVIEKLYS